MLVSRLWRRAVRRRLWRNKGLLSHEETSDAVLSSVSSHRQGFFTGRNVCFGCTSLYDVLHGSTPSMHLFKGGFFTDKESGFGCAIFVWARSRSAENRRCFCTSEAQIVDGNVGSFDLQPDNSISNWVEQIQPFQTQVSLRHGTVRKAVHASDVGCDDSVSHHHGAEVDDINDSSFPRQSKMGGLVRRNVSMRRTDTQTDEKWEASDFMGDTDAQDDYGLGEKLDDSDDEVVEENLLSMQSKDHYVFTPADKKIVKAICALLNKQGWSPSTKKSLETQFSGSLNAAVMSAIILRQKDVALASSVFQWACKYMGHNFRTYHAYLIRLGQTKHFDKMWALLSKMKENGLEVSERTFCMIIRACGVAGVPTMAVDAYIRAHDYDVVSNTNLHQALLTMFFESNLIEDAKILYSIMVQEGLAFDTHMFNALITGFNRFLSMKDVESSFNTMLKEGLEPNILSYNGLIEAYCSVRHIEKAMSAFADLQRSGLKPTATTVNLLLVALLKMRRVSDAVDLFTSMNTVCTPNQSTFNILLRGLLICNATSKAISLFSLMKQEGLTNLETFTYLESGLRASQQTERTQQFLKVLFSEYGYEMKFVYTALLDSLCRSGELDEAESLFNGMLESSEKLHVPSCEIMIALYTRLGMLDRALELLSELKGKGLRLTVLCYVSLVIALLKASRVADASKFAEEILEAKHELSAFICDYLLKELCKHGMVDDALHVFNTILRGKFGIHKRTLMELMKVLCQAGKVEEASSCFRALHKLHRLPLPKAAGLQALSVMDIMSCSSNEK